MTQFSQKFGIHDENLAIRREFIRLDRSDQEILVELEPWAKEVSADIAREFYDWQFSFRPTLRFFEQFAAQKGIPLSALRGILEKSQAQYVHSAFAGAKSNWDVAYFEHRLHVGGVHDRINLPLKWYVGSYVEMFRLVRQHLREHWTDPVKVMRAEDAISKVFNYDMQAICESFLLNTLDSMGLDVSAIREAPGTDKTESLSQIKDAIQVLMAQCGALAEGRLREDVFSLSAPAAGTLGIWFGRIRETLLESLKNIAQNAGTLAAAAEQLQAVSHQMAANAEETSVQATNVVHATGEVSRRVSEVATNSDEMRTSIQEISRSAHQAAAMVTSSVSAADSVNQKVQRLGDSSIGIGKVLKVIGAVARQTNLLALNATLEAARAGEAGRGFAVVAKEVKELARETAKATAEIAEKIEGIQTDTRDAVGAMAEITTMIGDMKDISSSIAAAVEEQTVATREINRNVSEAASGTGRIAENISAVATAAQDTTRGANETQMAAQALSDMAVQLQSLVGRFQI